jgi:predicted acylesterase/phospholipase RssA
MSSTNLHIQMAILMLHTHICFLTCGSLGAYEAGAYQAIYERITKTDREKAEKNKPFLNIVAGTSIGAINAAIIVSYVVENGTWDEFWEYVSKESSFGTYPCQVLQIGGIICITTFIVELHQGRLQEDIIQQRNSQLQECLQFFPL